MITILVVDDETDFEYILRRRFRIQVQQNIYQFRFVHNGLDALTVIQNEPDIDLVLLDINMPDLNGLQLLEQLPGKNPLMQVVMVSAYGDMMNIRQAMNRGAFDFVNKPIDMLDLEQTLQKTARHIQHLREARQLKLIDEVKTRFYDNITHEFRTPLTLILTPLAPLLTEFAHLPPLHQTLTLIDRNARQLLRQINQLLDLAQLESGQFRVAPAVADMGDYLQRIVADFVPLAQSKQLTLSFVNELSGQYSFDPYLIECIACNLLTNALKFTQQGYVTVRLARIRSDDNGFDWIRLSVQDTGLGIQANKLPYIFDRFYQAHQPAASLTSGSNRAGTGIGLALVQEITQLLNGTLEVTSTAFTENSGASGTLFTLELPLNLPPINNPPVVVPPPPLNSQNWANERLSSVLPVDVGRPSGDERPLLLLVDDNDAILGLLSERLAHDYRLLTASTGVQAWELVQQELPEVVISDVMMPMMDGFELTKLIKTNPITDHIAVILLTAKGNFQGRLDGLKQGADDYLSKPFHLDELQLRIANQLTYRQNLRHHYLQQLSQPLTKEAVAPVTDQFLVRLYALLDEKLDGHLSVETVADALAMSRKTLYRKVQSLTQLAPNELIRMYRLRRGADLLKSGQAVAQVAYQVGFETPSHFAQAFRELYGQTPSEFAANKVRPL